MEAHMRTLVVAITMFGLLATGVKAADDTSPILGKLPDTEDNSHHVYLFTLKKNGIILKMSGDEFCRAMRYGEVVKHGETAFESRPKVVGPNDTVVPGDLEWVICRVRVKQ
jgi:hypothetical protein